MKKISLLLSIILVLTLVFAGCGGTDEEATAAPTQGQTATEAPEQGEATEAPAAQEAMTLKANYFGPETIPPGMGMAKASELLSEATDGTITVENYFSGTLVAYTDSFSACAKGIIDVAFVDATLVANVCSLNRVYSLPLTETPGDMFMMTESDRQLLIEIPELQKEMNDMNLQFISVCSLPGYNWHGVSFAPKAPEELKGIKVEAIGEGVPYLTEIGAAAVALDPGDYYMSLERGLVVGQLTHWAVVGNFKTGELCTYHTIFGDGAGGLYCPIMGYIMNLDTWNSLTPETQAAVVESYDAGFDYQLECDLPTIEEQNKMVVDRGDTIVNLTDAEREPWVEYMAPVLSEWVEASKDAGYDNAQAVYDRLMEIIAAAK
jgi:TRAP-type C4-dicarboxylate transport system substrate-binding protein